MNVTTTSVPPLTSRLINRILAIKPRAHFIKSRARKMMIERAEKMGVPWRKTVSELRSLDWESRRDRLQDPTLTYPDYYQTSFHAYDKARSQGNLETGSRRSNRLTGSVF